MHPSRAFFFNALLVPVPPIDPEKAPVLLVGESNQVCAKAEVLADAQGAQGSAKEGGFGADKGGGAWEEDVVKGHYWGNGRRQRSG